LQTGCMCLVVASVVGLIYWNFKIHQDVNVHRETYTTIVHMAVLQLIEAGKITDAHFAIAKISYAKAMLETVSKLAGGDAALKEITNLDIAKIINTATYQERQVRKYLQPQTTPHVLDSETIDS